MASPDQIDLAHAAAFRLGPITVEPALRQVTATRSETLEPRVMQVLVVLAMANGGIVSRDDLVRQCWEGRIVGDDSISRVIARLRKLAEEHGDGAFRIETITKVGYRLVGPVVLTAITSRPPVATETPDAPAIAPSPTRQGLWLLPAIAAVALITLAAGWRFLGPGVGSAAKPIVAVLPFTDMSDANGKAYFAQGLAEEILDTLAMDNRLTVLGGNTALAIRDNRADPDFARDKLGVTRLLEGSVRRGGGNETVRISVRLIDTATGSEIWSQRFDRSGANVAAVQEEVADAVALQLAGPLSGNAPEPARARTAVPPAAYEKVLVARQLLRTRQAASILQARALANEAVALAPDYTAAYATRSLSTEMAVSYAGLDPNELSLARRDAETAIKLDPTLPEGFYALGRFFGEAIEDYQSAIAPLQRALALRPDDAEARSALGRSYAFSGDINRAIIEFEKAVAIDPLFAVPSANLVRFYALADRGDAALAISQRFRAIAPDLAEADALDAYFALYIGQPGRGFMLARSALTRNPRYSNASVSLTEQAVLMFAADRLTAREWSYSDPSLFPQYAVSGNWNAFADSLLRNKPVELEKIWEVRAIAIAMLQSDRPTDLVRAFQARFPDVAAYTAHPGATTNVAVLLSHSFKTAGRAGDAKALRDFARARMMREEANGTAPSVNATNWAMLLASEGDRSGALRRLEDGLATTPIRVCSNDFAIWIGNWRPLAPLFGDPRFAAIKTRCTAEINKQRKIAGFSPAVFK